jgi:hypothetical protein
MSQRPHAMTDYLIATGLHLNDEMPLEEVSKYFAMIVPQSNDHAAWYCTSILLAGLRSGKLEPWEPILKQKRALINRWAGFWEERDLPPPYLAALFFMRFQKHSPLFMDSADHLIFLKLRNGRVENLEELANYFLEIEGPRTPDGVFAINTLDLSRAVRKRKLF